MVKISVLSNHNQCLLVVCVFACWFVKATFVLPLKSRMRERICVCCVWFLKDLLVLRSPTQRCFFPGVTVFISTDKRTYIHRHNKDNNGWAGTGFGRHREATRNHN